ncbi:MAG: glycoside hydrolase family 2 TIM barrel-domain containing protein [Bacteroidales bacterium]
MRKTYLLVFWMVSFISAVSCSNENNIRKTMLLSGEWSFSKGDNAIGDSGRWPENGIPAKLTRKVRVPHAWNAEKGMEKYTGICWYERSFELDDDDLSKEIRLQFDAVYHDATIYVNGKEAGKHLGSGYNRFYIPVTPFVVKGLNRLTVKVDNSPSRTNIPFMTSFDWANDGGITRNVYLLVTNKTAIRNIRVDAKPAGAGGTARIHIDFLGVNADSENDLALTASITEENQHSRKKIFKGDLNGEFKDGVFSAILPFDKVNAWHFDAPNLYKLNVRVSMKGKLVDEYSTTFGFRSIEVKNNRYYLNGEPIRLMGVEWMPGSSLEHGMAETKEELEKNLMLMKNANCIFTRFHWQQDEAVFDWCDRNGILVHEEIPYWGWVTLLSDTLINLGFQHLDEMITNHFNHPSIIAWGIGNELAAHDSTNIAGFRKLYKYAKSIDSSRLVNYVSNSLHAEYEKPDASSLFDMMMFNEYFSTWYGKTVDVVPSELDSIAKHYPGKALTISEWGVCEPVHKGGDPRRIEEMKKQIAFYESKEYVAGAIYFCLNDYRTHIGEDTTYSYPQRVHGVCDINLNGKPSYEILKQISSPVIVTRAEKGANGLQITLKGKTGIPSYTLRNYLLSSGNEKIQIDELKPGEEQTFEIRNPGEDFSLARPTGFEVLRVKVN